MVSFVTATIALVNSMIGSAILILPVLFVQNGLIISIAIIFIAALASGYLNTCSLEHTIENENDYSQTLERHHKDSNITFWYGFFLFLSSQLIFQVYFNLIVTQWNGLLYRVGWLVPYVPYLTLASLIIIVLSVRKVHCGVTLMAFGIVSTIAVVVFMFWLYATRPLPQTRRIELITRGPLTDLITLMSGGFSIQSLFVQVLKLHPIVQNRKKILVATFCTAFSVYFIIGWIGGNGILQRHPIITGTTNIMGYFDASNWQPFMMQIIYLTHLYSVFPQFLVVNAKKLFQILNTQQKQWKINIYCILSPTIGFIFYMFQVNLTFFINLNGGICAFITVIAIPMYTHIKCRYFPSKSMEIQQQYKIQQYDQNKECDKCRQQTTSTNKWIDLSILSIIGLFGLLSVALTLKNTLFAKLK